MRRILATMMVLSGTLALAGEASADLGVTLAGSSSSMERQHEVAVRRDYTFVETPAEVKELVEDSRLVPLRGGADYTLANVSHPVARPEVRTFVERLGAQHREACGERLVVTSLTRPQGEQPGNAHSLSVHPAGMAVDFRVSRNAECRTWLESTLLGLERAGVLDVTRERMPPHYHVAVFPDAYSAYVERQDAAARAPRIAAPVASLRQEPRPARAAAAAEAPAESGNPVTHGLAFVLACGLTAFLYYAVHRKLSGSHA
jgi:hypothetical protein